MEENCLDLGSNQVGMSAQNTTFLLHEQCRH